MQNAYLRPEQYEEEHCWQYDIRQKNLGDDLFASSLSVSQIGQFTVQDFYFSYVKKEDKIQCQEIKQFIQRHEWLGKLPNRPTHRFTARTKLHHELAGVVIMAVPNAFSLLLGKEYRDSEKLLSRGACISWAPKNLNSWLVMNSVRWMAKNTKFCYFTAYSDPEAKELGTIYQACNWNYLGQASGTIEQYFDPEHPEYGWFSDRNFRHKSKYNRYARELGIKLEKEWWGKYTLQWKDMPEEIVQQIKNAAKEYQAKCQVREVATKHKYAYILGKNKAETGMLKRRFARFNPDKVNLEYPKERGK